MTLTVDQRIRMLIGEYTIQITALQIEAEQVPALKAEIEKLKAQLAEKADAPAKETDDASMAAQHQYERIRCLSRWRSIK